MLLQCKCHLILPLLPSPLDRGIGHGGSNFDHGLLEVLRVDSAKFIRFQDAFWIQSCVPWESHGTMAHHSLNKKSLKFSCEFLTILAKCPILGEKHLVKMVKHGIRVQLQSSTCSTNIVQASPPDTLTSSSQSTPARNGHGMRFAFSSRSSCGCWKTKPETAWN